MLLHQGGWPPYQKKTDMTQMLFHLWFQLEAIFRLCLMGRPTGKITGTERQASMNCKVLFDFYSSSNFLCAKLHYCLASYSKRKQRWLCSRRPRGAVATASSNPRLLRGQRLAEVMSNRWKRSKEPELTLCQNLYSAYQALSANPNGSRHAFLQVLQAGSGELLLVLNALYP